MTRQVADESETHRVSPEAAALPEAESDWTHSPRVFPIVTLCGSSKFRAVFEAEQVRLTMAGNLVISLGLFGHTDFPNLNWERSEACKLMLDEMHFAKIDLAERVHVIDPAGYIGESTAREIAYAESRGKRVTYWSESDK